MNGGGIKPGGGGGMLGGNDMPGGGGGIPGGNDMPGGGGGIPGGRLPGGILVGGGPGTPDIAGMPGGPGSGSPFIMAMCCLSAACSSSLAITPVKILGLLGRFAVSGSPSSSARRFFHAARSGAGMPSMP